MKKLTIIFLLFCTICYSQTKQPESKYKKQFTPLVKTKDAAKTGYFFDDVIEVKNGKDETVKVTFTMSVPIATWEDLVKQSGFNERLYLNLIANTMTVNAKYTLKNNLAFEPFKKQFIFFNKGRFVCEYKMMARNGFGNLVETSSYVFYQPEDKSKIPVSKNIDKDPVPVEQ